jgi:hypothetical protein
MNVACKALNPAKSSLVQVSHHDKVSPRRAAVESFIQSVFSRHYGANVRSFAPQLMLVENSLGPVAAAGWRSAKDSALFLENYLDQPIERAMAKLADQPIERNRIVEVGHLAAEQNGGSLHVILALAAHLHRHGHEWVVFTATRELVSIFARLGLPLLALAKADPSRLGEGARDWGSYYDTEPVIVAGRIRLAMERLGKIQ